MAAKSASNRRTTASKNSVSSAAAHHDEHDKALEDTRAYEPGFNDDDESEASYLASAQTRVRELTRQREGRVVVAALATGFAIGAAIGCVIAGSRERKQTWSDRLACEGLGRRLLDRIGGAAPESISERFSR